MSAGADPDQPVQQPAPGDDAEAAAPLTGARIRGLFTAASASLERNAPAIDAINVFPVPDGDTGSNMAATLRDTISSLGASLQPAGEVTAALARSALMSARGNSGVILSQILRGFAEATAGVERLDGPALARALAAGSRAAYAALEHPVEGTILTVARAAAQAAEKVKSTDPRAVLEAALAGARTALAHTPDLLPVLKQAGVVDSGGYGLVVMLEGAMQFLRGEVQPETVHPIQAPSRQWVEHTNAKHGAGSPFGYCTQYLLAAQVVDLDSVRVQLAAIGDSVLVVGDETVLRVHVHTDDPGTALRYGTAQGVLTGIKIDNMQAQYDRFSGGNGASRELSDGTPAGSRVVAPAISLVAVVAGDGFAEIAKSLGATRIVYGGQTMNPSVEEILNAINEESSQQVIVLPNNKNVVFSSEQAASLASRAVSIVKTYSIPQGLSALLAFNSDRTLAENVAAMQRAAGAVRTIEVTRAARSVRIGDLSVRQGEPIGLIDDVLAVTAATPEEVLVAALRQVAPEAGAAVALYYGAAVGPERVADLQARLQECFPAQEVETIAGGQPFYDYILSVE